MSSFRGSYLEGLFQVMLNFAFQKQLRLYLKVLLKMTMLLMGLEVEIVAKIFIEMGMFFM